MAREAHAAELVSAARRPPFAASRSLKCPFAFLTTPAYSLATVVDEVAPKKRSREGVWMGRRERDWWGARERHPTTHPPTFTSGIFAERRESEGEGAGSGFVLVVIGGNDVPNTCVGARARTCGWIEFSSDMRRKRSVEEIFVRGGGGV